MEPEQVKLPYSAEPEEKRPVKLVTDYVGCEYTPPERWKRDASLRKLPVMPCATHENGRPKDWPGRIRNVR